MYKYSRFLGGFAFVFLPLLLAGCFTFTHDLDLEPVLDKLPEVEQAPVTVGIYYSPEFASYEHIRTSGSHVYVAPVGERSAAMLDEIFPRIFAKVVKLDMPPTSAKPKSEVDWVIEPAVEAVDFRLGFDSDSDRYSLTYRFTVYSKEGFPVSSWTVLGKGKSTSFAVYNHISVDMEDAAAKILRKFQAAYADGKPPMVPPRSLANHGNSGKAPLAGAVSVNAELNMEPEWLRDILAPPENTAKTDDDPARKEQARKNETGIIPVWITVKNLSERTIQVKEPNFRLVLPNGRRIAPAGANAVQSQLESPDHTGALVGGLLGLIITIASNSEEDRLKRLDQFRELRFGEQTLVGGYTAQGLAYFIPAKGTPAFNEARLSLWLEDSESSNGVEYSLALKDIAYQGSADDD